MVYVTTLVYNYTPVYKYTLYTPSCQVKDGIKYRNNHRKNIIRERQKDLEVIVPVLVRRALFVDLGTTLHRSQTIKNQENINLPH
jgi:hypothetical protein